MPKFSAISRQRLETCHEDLQRLFREVVKYVDCSILEGHRGRERQEQMVAEGKSKVHWPGGKHNTEPSNAVDVAPYPIDWEDIRRWYYFGGYVQATAQQMGIPVRWGGDWKGDHDFSANKFNDLPHWERIEA